MDEKDVKKAFPKSFWRDVLAAWANVNDYTVSCVEDIARQIIWLNSDCKRKGKI